jgi:hypothetical protein
MSNRIVRTASAFAPNRSADALVAAVPRALPPLSSFAFAPPANAAMLHRPRRGGDRYIAQTALNLFRVR